MKIKPKFIGIATIILACSMLMTSCAKPASMGISENTEDYTKPVAEADTETQTIPDIENDNITDKEAKIKPDTSAKNNESTKAITEKSTDKTASDAESVSKLAIEEFLSFTKVPRPGYKTKKALSYLQTFADNHGLEHFRDDYGNFWMDIPATEGCEKYPKVILQAHMDMVCVSESGEDIDFENTGIKAIVDEEKGIITADGTSLGADNGIGVGMILAIAQSDSPHGPLRALITADEDVGLVGASELDSTALDADYLINIDNEVAGQIVYSSAGTVRNAISKKFDKANPLLLNEQPLITQNVYHFSIEGLLGGHSGVDIAKNRLSSAVALTEILKAYQQAGVEISISEISCGEAFNSIARNADVTFSASNENEEKLNEITREAVSNLEVKYPNENIICHIDSETGTDGYFLSVEDTNQIIDVISALPQGVLKMSETKEGQVQTSINIGSIELNEGIIKIQLSGRSCVTDDLTKLENDTVSLAENNGYTYERVGWYPGWDGDPEAPLLKLTEKAFKENGIEPVSEAIHGGLECSWFAEKRPGIQIVCIGSTIENCHSPSETLYIDTVKQTATATLYCLAHIKEL